MLKQILKYALLVSGIHCLFVEIPPAWGHGFGQRYDLPVPLGLFMIGAGAAVFLSFLGIGVLVGGGGARRTYPRFNLRRLSVGRFLTHPVFLAVMKSAAALAFLLTLLAGFIGVQNPAANLVPTMVWIIWWVGVAYVCAVVGNLWELFNPWRTIFQWADWLYQRFDPEGGLSNERPFPEWIGVWPAVLLFLWFAWGEIVWSGNSRPDNLAFAALYYSLITWFGMLFFGRERWLRQGEAFSVTFALLARFALTEIRVTNPDRCQACSSGDCGMSEASCVNCQECFAQAEEGEREWNLRPPAMGLLNHHAVHPSMMVMVLLVLSTVTFDGFTETSTFHDWRGILFGYLEWIGRSAVQVTDTVALAVFPVLFLAVYLLFSALMRLMSRTTLTTLEMARLFVFSLIPIAIGYHLAHYFSFLLIQGQRIIPLASDPFGFGWNLLGTAGYQIDIAIVGAKTVWYVSVAAIVFGHIFAVYLAHVTALGALQNRFDALRSQYPMLVLMVAYTMVSLWIIAQPIVEG